MTDKVTYKEYRPMLKHFYKDKWHYQFKDCRAYILWKDQPLLADVMPLWDGFQALMDELKPRDLVPPETVPWGGGGIREKKPGEGEQKKPYTPDKVIELGLMHKPTGWFYNMKDFQIFGISSGEARLIKGDAVHWFVESDELAAFLKDTASRSLDAEMLEALIRPDGSWKETAGVVHTPSEVYFYYYFRHKGKGFEEDKNWLGVSTGDYFQFVTWFDKTGLRNTDSVDGPIAEAYQLIFGMGLYTACFPHAVRDGLPEDIRFPQHHKKDKKKTLVAVPEVQVERGSPRPHFRVGHFRYLKSDRYTHKRGQWVFVKQTFVKGRAKTVEEVAEVAAEVQEVAAHAG